MITQNAPLSDPENFQNRARALAAERGWFLVDQFRNPASVRAHAEGTGPEILEQAGGQIGALVAGVGTGGTITGVGRVLRRRAHRARGPGRVRARGVGARPRARARRALPRRGDRREPPARVFDASVVDEVEEVTDAESFAVARRARGAGSRGAARLAGPLPLARD